MNIGLYQSAASLSALERWQDAVSQNITSSQVSGYKKRTVDISAQLMGEHAADKNTRVGDGMPAYFPRASYGISYQAGEVEPTRRDLDVAIQGEGFFAIQTSDGSKIYTRAGEFTMRNDRTLINASGAEVLSDGGNPIMATPQGGPIVINKDGSVYQRDVLLGKLQVVKFEDNSRLRPRGSGGFVANGMDPIPVEKPEVIQGYLEGSNITPLREMVDLVTISRAYEANQKLIQSRDDLFGKALEKLG
ncbi:MAG: flagellar hook-basal body protein [Opitutaceae bacterium]|jgi:flagellar basal body rod protein FlgG